MGATKRTTRAGLRRRSPAPRPPSSDREDTGSQSSSSESDDELSDWDPDADTDADIAALGGHSEPWTPIDRRVIARWIAAQPANWKEPPRRIRFAGFLRKVSLVSARKALFMTTELHDSTAARGLWKAATTCTGATLAVRSRVRLRWTASLLTDVHRRHRPPGTEVPRALGAEEVQAIASQGRTQLHISPQRRRAGRKRRRDRCPCPSGAEAQNCRWRRPTCTVW